MRRGKKIGIVVVAVMSLMLTACGESVPEMTEEENSQVVEYAAGLLLKYDQNYETRLVEEDSEAETEETKNVEVKKDAQKPEEETPTVSADVNTSYVEQNKSVEDFYGVKGVEAKYIGYDLKEIYPDENVEEATYAVSAENGYKLLVLNFEIKNTTGQALDINMASAGGRFKISVNGAEPEYALTTILLNDLSSFAGTLEAGETKNLVLVGEVPLEEVDSISSVVLVMKEDSENNLTVSNDN
ncbi:MAG: hypothetical protein GX235_11800 [Clostridiales bacterium]|nr:hypothetical protein [Clostridiales bacterium]